MRHLLFPCAALAAVLTAPAVVRAQSVTYDYTGKYFNDFPSQGALLAPQQYTTSDSVTAWFTVASALPANLSGATIVPTAFSFSDGVQTINSANSTYSAFYIWTDSAGNIDNWSVGAQQLYSIDGHYYRDYIATYSTIGLPDGAAEDYGTQILCGPQSSEAVCQSSGSPYYEVAGRVNSPGEWAVPEPSDLGPILAGLAVIGMTRRRRRRT